MHETCIRRQQQTAPDVNNSDHCCYFQIRSILMRRVESFPSYHGKTLAYPVILPRLPAPRGRQLSDTKYVNRPRIALPSLGFTGMLTLQEEVARTDPSKGSPGVARPSAAQSIQGRGWTRICGKKRRKGRRAGGACTT